jgi:hypothetical protein
MSSEPLDRQALRSLLEGASPRPWDDWDGYGELTTHFTVTPYKEIIVMRGRDFWSGCNHTLHCDEADAKLITAAVNSLEPLLDHIDALEAENERMRHALSWQWTLGQYNWTEEFNGRPPIEEWEGDDSNDCLGPDGDCVDTHVPPCPLADLEAP